MNRGLHSSTLRLVQEEHLHFGTRGPLLQTQA